MTRKSIVFISLLVILLEMTAAQTVLDECGQCQPENCPSTSNCLAGGYRDKCGCCVVCGRLEGEKCDNYTLPLPQKDQYGFCGDQMVCLLRKDLEKTVIHSEFRSSFFPCFCVSFSNWALEDLVGWEVSKGDCGRGMNLIGLFMFGKCQQFTRLDLVNPWRWVSCALLLFNWFVITFHRR